MAHTNALALVLDNRQRVCVRHFVAWFLRHRSSGGYHPSCFALFTLTGYLTDQISGTAITRRTLVRRSARHLGISGGIPRDNATFGKSVALATQGCANRVIIGESAVVQSRRGLSRLSLRSEERR